MPAPPDLITLITQFLSQHPGEMSVMSIAEGLGLNRNLVAKYLSTLHLQGRVEVKAYGTMKMYRLSNRIPFSLITRLSADPVIGLDKLFYIKEFYGPLADYQLPNERIIGKNCSEIMHPCFSDDLFYELLRSIIEGRMTKASREYRNSDAWHQVTAISTIFDDRTTGVAISFLDITNQKRIERESVQWKDKYLALTRDNPRFVIHLSPDGKTRYLNPAFSSFFNIRPEEIIGSELLPGLTDTDIRILHDRLKEVTPDCPNQTLEHKAIMTDGTIRWLHWDITGIFSDASLAEYHLSGSDVSQVKLMESKITQYESGLEQILHEKTEELREVTRTLALEHERRRTAERESQLREARFISLVESMNDFVWEIGSDNRFEYVNSYFLNRCEYSADEITGSDLYSLVYKPEEQDSLKKVIEACRTLKESQSVRLRIRKKTGDNLLIDLVCSPVINYDGDITSVRGIGRDISEKVRSEFENRKLQTIIEKTSDIILMSDETGNITYMNESGRIILQIPQEQPSGMYQMDQFLSPPSLSIYENGRKLARRDGFWCGQMTLLSLRGRNVPVTKVIIAHQSAQDEPILYFTISRDNTERMLHHQELSRIHSYNRILIETSIDPLVTIGADGKIQDVNKATENVTGYAKEELIGTNFCKYFTEPKEAEEGYRRVFNDGTVRNYPLEIRSRDGMITPVEYNASVYRDENGEIQGVFASARDISVRRLREREIARINAYNRSLIESNIDPLVTIGPDGLITDANLATEMITGHVRQDLIGTNFSRYFTEPLKAEEGYMKVFSDGFVRNFPLVIIHKNGTTTPVEYNASVFRDENGEIQGVFAAARDMSLLYSIREQMKDLLNHYMTIFEGFPLPIVRFNNEKECDFINQAYRNYTGISDIETDCTSILTNIHPDDRDMVNNNLVKMNQDHLPVSCQCRHLHRDGTYHWIQKYGVPLFSYNGIFLGTICTFMDIHAERKFSEQIRESEIRFRELFNHMNQGAVIYQYSPERGAFIIQDLNHAAEMIDQIMRDDIIGQSVEEAFPGIAEFGLLDVMKRVYDSGVAEMMPDAYYSDLRISGWRENYVFRLQSGDIISMYSDITKKREYDEQLRKREMLFHTMIQKAVDWEYWQREDGSIAYSSPAIEHMTGYSVSDFIMHPGLIDEIVHPDFHELWQSHTCCTQTTEQPIHIRLKIIGKDGLPRWITHICTSIFSRDGEFLGRRVSNRKMENPDSPGKEPGREPDETS